MITLSPGGEACTDDSQTVAEIADLDVLRRHHIVRPDCQHDVLRLIGQHGRVRYEQRRHRRPNHQATRAKPPGVRRPSALGTVARAWIVPLV